MQLHLKRDTFTPYSTIGVLWVDGVRECETLEDKDRKLEAGGKKVFGQTCIPRGSYQVIIAWSDHFKRELPRLLDVPEFEGVLIHSGNKPADTEGCILVGTTRSEDWVGNSRIAFNRLFEKLEQAYEKNEQIVLVIE